MKTKIVITIGPKTESPEAIRKVIEAGADMIRFNFSHASFEQFTKVSKEIKKIAKELGREVSILLDLQGPRIRVGRLPDDGVMLKSGSTYGFTTGKTELSNNLIAIDYKDLHVDIKKGDLFFLSNGAIELVVTGIKNQVIWCKVMNGGMLFSHKGVNVPNTTINRGGLTDKDIRDVKFGLDNGNVDFIALSFVQSAEDVIRLKKLIEKYGPKKRKIGIISKIERAAALADIDRVIVESDAIMFARGDLGIEIPVENLPIIQKNIIRHAHWHNTPTIIATQVLTSMITNEYPTRAEVSDISNAIFDRADAVMLSDETAVGDNAIGAVKMLKKVIRRTEQYLDQKNFFDEGVQKDLANKYTNFNLGQ